MRTYDLSPTKDKYYRQNNNELDPQNVCKPESTVMALDIAGWSLPKDVKLSNFDLTLHMQPGDNLTELCRCPDGVAKMLSIDPALKGTPPNEVWGVIAWALDQWYPSRRPYVGPRWDWSFKEMLYGISIGRPFAASTWLSKGGHVVCVVGFETRQDEDLSCAADLNVGGVCTIIVDDPYGLKLLGPGYDISRSGYHTLYDISAFLKTWRGIGLQIVPYKEA